MKDQYARNVARSADERAKEAQRGVSNLKSGLEGLNFGRCQSCKSEGLLIRGAIYRTCGMYSGEIHDKFLPDWVWIPDIDYSSKLSAATYCTTCHKYIKCENKRVCEEWKPTGE